MTKEIGCLICKHIGIKIPADWTPRWPGDEYSRFDVRKIIWETKEHQKVWCALNPVWVEVFTNHYCSQFVKDHPLAGEHTVHDFIWGSYQSRENTALERKNKDLRQQLKRSQEVSASRLARLKKEKQDAQPSTGTRAAERAPTGDAGDQR